MAYSTVAQVAAEFKDITFSSTSAVTDTDVTRFIEEADAEINARVGLKYALPITGSESLIVLRKFSIQLVAFRIKEILRVKSGGVATDQATRGSSSRFETEEDRIKKELEKVSLGTVLLSDATLKSAADGVRSFGVDANLEHNFQIGVDQW